MNYWAYVGIIVKDFVDPDIYEYVSTTNYNNSIDLFIAKFYLFNNEK